MNHSLLAGQRRRDEVIGLGQWQSWLLYGWVLLLIVSPLLLLGPDSSTAPARYIDVRTHAIVELFCGITALLIAALIMALSRRYQGGSLNLFALGFLVMGLLDVLHSATPPAVYPGLFVASHTLSIFFGGALLCMGAVRYYRAHQPPTTPLRLSG